MFTGIIEAVGTVRSLESRGSDMRVTIRSGELDLGDVKLGDSIAVNGICLTVVCLPGDGFVADVSNETVGRSAFADLKVGSRVNLEKALTPTTRLGGHLVSGHVDGVGELLSLSNDGRSVKMRIQAPAELAKYIAEKGSITVDGVSLTVNGVNGRVFDLNIIPHTMRSTTLIDFSAGQHINLEVDLVARYLERLLLGERAAQGTDGDKGEGITLAFLAQHGFMK
ncbi:MAG: riboflavin synthase [Chromatiales bacterium]|nr:riboflavin synthase [Chromatiales bacterium]